MRVVVGQGQTLLLRWGQRILFAVAGLALGYCAFAVADMWLYQARRSQELQKLSAQKGVKGTGASPGMPARGQGEAPALEKGALVGRIEIPRLGVSVVVAEGTDDNVLRHAAGHIEGTAFPGQGGNVGIAAHRDTFFRPLRNIRKNDEITVTTKSATYRYRVEWTKVVGPDDVWVLGNSGTEDLTLVTCFPFYFVGPAPKRFVIRAQKDLAGPPARSALGEMTKPIRKACQETTRVQSPHGHPGGGDRAVHDGLHYAAIDPGNSGGALINVRGELTGVETAILSGGRGGSQGVGFAVPINLARQVMEQILNHEKVIRGWLGVVVQPVSPAMARASGVAEARAALLGDVAPNGPAERAGLHRGDIILDPDGKPIADSRALSPKVAMMPPVTNVKLKLGEMPGKVARAAGEATAPGRALKALAAGFERVVRPGRPAIGAFADRPERQHPVCCC